MLNGREHLVELGMDEEIILKKIVRKNGVRIWT
jgi:hypothetical protein